MRKDTSSAEDDTTTDIDDIVKRLTCVSDGCETQEITVIKNQQVSRSGYRSSGYCRRVLSSGSRVEFPRNIAPVFNSASEFFGGD